MTFPWHRPIARPWPTLLAAMMLWMAALSTSAVAAEDANPNAEAAGQVTVPQTVAELEALEQRVQEVVAKVLPSIVAVRIGSSQGSGVIVSKDGYVLTAGHVVGEPNKEATVIFPDGKSVKGTTLGRNREADAGLMKITDQGQWPSLEMGRSADLKAGTWSVAVGHPLGYQKGRPPVIRVGRILRNEAHLIRTDCPLVAGDSGGPLVDLDGKVIGINSRISGSTTMNFHVPVDVFHDCWERLVKGEMWDDPIPGKDSSEVKAVFEQLVAEAAACVVRVKSADKETALGTIVGPDGWVLTKASEIKEPIVCTLRDGRDLAARIVGINEQYDLAMLKVDASDLPPIAWSQQPDPAVGQWVAAAGAEGNAPLALGVVSVPRRPIAPPSGVLGITLETSDQGAKITKILPGTPAQKAGLRENDIVLEVNGKATPDHTDVIDAIREYQPGDTVRLKIKRDDKTLQITAKLAKLQTPGSQKREMQNRSDVGISRRHDDFPTVLQHDTVLKPTDCGGPLVNLSGKVVGVNIARGGRTETYAIPTDVLLTLMYDLMSGRLAPPKPKPESKKPDKPAPKPPEEKPEPKPPPEPQEKPESKPEPAPEKQPAPEQKPQPEEKPAPEQKPGPEAEPPPEEQPSPEKNPEPEPEPAPEEKPESEGQRE